MVAPGPFPSSSLCLPQGPAVGTRALPTGAQLLLVPVRFLGGHSFWRMRAIGGTQTHIDDLVLADVGHAAREQRGPRHLQRAPGPRTKEPRSRESRGHRCQGPGEVGASRGHGPEQEGRPFQARGWVGQRKSGAGSDDEAWTSYQGTSHTREEAMRWLLRSTTGNDDFI